MKQLFAFLGQFALIGQENEKRIDFLSISSQLCLSLENSVNKLFDSDDQSLGSCLSMVLDAPFVVTTYHYSPQKIVLWMFYHSIDVIDKVFQDQGPIILSINSEVQISCQFSILPVKVPSCCLEVRWKKDEADPRVVNCKLHQICIASGGLVAYMTRHNGTVFQFLSPETAIEVLSRGKELLNGETSHSIRNISLNEHCVLGCKWVASGYNTFIPTNKKNEIQQVSIM